MTIPRKAFLFSMFRPHFKPLLLPGILDNRHAPCCPSRPYRGQGESRPGFPLASLRTLKSFPKGRCAACTIAVSYTHLDVYKRQLPRLFDRFYRGTNTDAAGYGIGLALCKTILVRQGGTITAKNHPQGGAVFSIRFPK